jgi:hypothetical protein
MTLERIGVGIDVGAQTLHAARVAGAAVNEWQAFSASDLSGVVAFCRGSHGVAVDAPSGLSAGSHRDDLSIAPKFRTGRCSEVAARPAVPWMAPMAGQPVPGWMAVGFELWAALRDDGHDPLEVFPAGCFHRLNQGRWPARKTTPEGRRARLAMLGGYLALPPAAPGWGHDIIDAAVAGLVAYQGREGGHPAPHRCPRPDGSQMWFPAAG